MPITTDLATSTGQIRLLIGDNTDGDGVKPGGANFTDEEIAYFFDRGGSIDLGAALACETLAYLWNTHPDFEADGLRVDRGKISAGWSLAGARFRANAGARVLALIREDAFSTDLAANLSSNAVDGDGLP